MTSRLSCFLLALLTAATLFAQTSIRGDGREAVAHTGIALVKPQKWSKPNEAVPVRFTAYTNRGGYFVLRSQSGQERQVWVEQIVGGKPLLTPEIPAQILTPADRKKIQDEIDELKKLVAQVPSAAIDISQLSKPLAEAAQRYDAGEVRVGGYWTSAADYRAAEFYSVQKQLRQFIEESPDKTKFELEENSNFKKLVELSEGTPALKAKVDTLRADLEKQVLDQRQADALARFMSPNISDADAQVLLVELQGFKNPTEKTTLILQQAENSKLLTGEIEKFRAAVEGYFATPAPADAPPRLPADLAFQSEMLAGQIAKFRGSSPPPSIRIPEENARALVEFCGGFPQIAPLLEKKNYLEAAALLTRLSANAEKIGPATQAALAPLKASASQKADAFLKLRAEGETAEKAGNAKDAIAKYTAAIEIFPSPDISAKIEQLKTPAKK